MAAWAAIARVTLPPGPPAVRAAIGGKSLLPTVPSIAGVLTE